MVYSNSQEQYANSCKLFEVDEDSDARKRARELTLDVKKEYSKFDSAHDRPRTPKVELIRLNRIVDLESALVETH